SRTNALSNVKVCASCTRGRVTVVIRVLSHGELLRAGSRPRNSCRRATLASMALPSPGAPKAPAAAGHEGVVGRSMLRVRAGTAFEVRWKLRGPSGRIFCCRIHRHPGSGFDVVTRYDGAFVRMQCAGSLDEARQLAE